jgi:hypothetical protein
MKNKFKIILLFLCSLIFFIACDEGERFTGSPVGNLDIITLDATISSTSTLALTDQKIDFTVTLPRTFADTVRVEASSLSDSGRRTRGYVEIMPNQLTGTGEINAAGGGVFNSTFDLFVSAIELYTVEAGKHYLIKSNNIEIQTGNTTIQDANGARLSVKLVWPNFSTSNNLRFNVDKPEPLVDANVTSLSGGKTHFINIDNNGANNTTTNSSAEGEYVFKITALSLTTSPIDMPYRLVLVHPDGKTEVFNGVYPGLVVGAPLLPVLKVVKTGDKENAVFTATQL